MTRGTAEIEANVKIVALRTGTGPYTTIQVPGDGGLVNVQIRESVITGYAPFFVDPETGYLLAWAIIGHERVNRSDQSYEFPQTPEEATALWDSGTPAGAAPTRTGLNAQMRSVGLEAMFEPEQPEQAEADAA